MAISDAQPRATAPHGGFEAIVRRARRLAAHIDDQIGWRELLLAIAIGEPGGVVKQAIKVGLDATRLTWAASEWWSGPDQTNAESAVALTRPAAEAIARAKVAAERDAAPPWQALLGEILAGAGADRGAIKSEGVGETAPDLTGSTLRALDLI